MSAAPASTAEQVDIHAAPRRDVIFHLTPFAKGLEMADINDRRRSLALFTAPPLAAVRTLLDRLSLKPNAVRVEPMENGELAVVTPGRAGSENRWVTAAFAWEGLTLDEARAALSAIEATTR